ncbi:MAG: signal peptidase I [Candidatus Microbacterium colombiense]|nr:MAG: signal peptidase I [Microbacterium sp.]
MTTDSPSVPASKRRRGVLVFLRDVLVIILIAAVVSFVVKTFVVRSFYIPSASMERTLLIKDRILVDELTPRWTAYERGDVVVFKDPGGWLDAMPQTPAAPPLVQAVDWVLNFVGIAATDAQDHLVKRIIGLPGDHVVCCNALGQITINGAAIDELGYLNLPQGDTAASNEPFDVVVPEGSLWLLGDNRDRSRDARAHQDLPSGGFVPLENVVGKAFLTTWPLDRMGAIDGHHEIFNGVPDPR